MVDATSALILLAARLIKCQAEKTLGDKIAEKAGDVAAEYAGERLLDKLVQLVSSAGNTAKVLEAFKDADGCFAEKCGDDKLRQMIISTPLAALPSLERLAATLPKTLDDEGLLIALRRQFVEDWSGQLSDAQVDRAALVYRDCLSVALAVKCDQLGVWTYLEVRGARSDLREIKSRLIELADLAQFGPREWLRPPPPRPGRPMIGRQDESTTVRRLLRPGSKAAITATLHGTPGVGKTLLAEHLAFALDGQFPGGVLFEQLGAGFRDPALATPRLKAWAGYAYGGRALEEGIAFTPEAVRALLAGHGGLLVVLDDVWEIKAIRPFLDALPPEACLLITTRSERLAKELRGDVYSLDVLSGEDALALLRARVRASNDADRPLLERLAQALGNHAQALDIAGGSLDRLSRSQWPAAVAEMERQVREGSGFGELHLPGDEETESRVEAALYVSYADLNEAAQARFRALGVFALDDSFRAEAAAGVWGCPVDQAHGQLTIFFERGLLKRLEDEHWQQHSLLRAYALALQRRAGEEDAGRERHAAVHLGLMRDADDRQVYYLMLSDYPQLRHAFEWAIEHNPSLAQALAGSTAILQAAFSLVNDSYAWAVRLVASARKSDDTQSIGAALVTLGNALSCIAALPGEDRRARLLEALAAYDEALRYRRPEVAPLAYATTQNNRANRLSEIAALPGEDRRARLLEALQCAWTALTMIEHIGHEPYARVAANTLRGIGEEAGEMFDELWAELNAGNPPAWLVQHLQWRLVPQALRGELSAYLEARRRADEENAYEAWMAAATSGGELLAHPDAPRLPFVLDELRADVADCWNRLGTILSDEQKKPEEALAAFEEAVRLRPDFAMYWRNHAGTNIDLGNLDAAAASLARAGELEPDHPRLAELRKELDEARRKLTGESSDFRSL